MSASNILEDLAPAPMGTITQQTAIESPAKKRKRNADSQASTENGSKMIKSKKRKVAEDGDLDLALSINKSFSQMDNQLMADYVAQKTRKFESELSSVELEDRLISANSIRDTTDWNMPRTLDNLPTFLEKFCSNPTKLWSASKKNGAPHTIIVAGAGQRAADLARVIRKLQTKDAAVAKLFAKHIKLNDAAKFLRSTRTGMAVGTPKRLEDLMDEGALAIDRLERIIIDVSHVDQKKRGILEMRETQVPLIQWLSRNELKGRFSAGESKIDLMFY